MYHPHLTLSLKDGPDRVSVHGGYMLGVNRSGAHSGSQTLICHTQCPHSRQTIYKWERLLSANLQVQSQHWFERHYHVLDRFHELLATGDAMPARIKGELETGKAFSMEIHRVRADATKTNVTVQHKGHNCELHSRILHIPELTDGVADPCLEQPEYSEAMASLPDVADSTTWCGPLQPHWIFTCDTCLVKWANR